MPARHRPVTCRRTRQSAVPTRWRRVFKNPATFCLCKTGLGSGVFWTTPGAAPHHHLAHTHTQTTPHHTTCRIGAGARVLSGPSGRVVCLLHGAGALPLLHQHLPILAPRPAHAHAGAQRCEAARQRGGTRSVPPAWCQRATSPASSPRAQALCVRGSGAVLPCAVPASELCRQAGRVRPPPSAAPILVQARSTRCAAT